VFFDARRTLLLCALLLPSAGTVSANPTVEAMKQEALAETSPDSLGMVNYMLTTTFVRGNKDLGAYTYLLKLVIQHTLNLAEQRDDGFHVLYEMNKVRRRLEQSAYKAIRGEEERTRSTSANPGKAAQKTPPTTV